MKQLHSVVIPGGQVRHLAHHYSIKGPYKTLCGLLWTNGHVDELDTPYAMTKTRVCHNCLRARRNHDVDTILPEVDQGAATRGRALADGGTIREVEGRLYRVQGSTDAYTVTVPEDVDLASVCTCMAAKTHPEAMCKHQAAVFLYEAREMSDE